MCEHRWEFVSATGGKRFQAVTVECVRCGEGRTGPVAAEAIARDSLVRIPPSPRLQAVQDQD